VILHASAAEFVPNMENVLETYETPYDSTCPVICMDEQPVQLVRGTRQPIAATKDHARRVDYENELSSMTRQCLNDRRIGESGILQEEIAEWSLDVSSTQSGVDWRMEIDDARCKIKSISPKTLL
jgi:hypothetical protein